ncbi:hypothetical protein C1878_13705 [Gordonibacter sp. 28C]|uniref:zinc-ribbon domain-containing protein n=1 Tax=Gordonibacter sp. 28C TaxID=2078569 RepID=UPI000DF7216C|nr:zinc-ribbon domain-containing protein [Gordonibacter sp. 28C]RDB60507.1 hypothetical protein C1878_13705 [Gordonibacter sp. 28C]
MCIPCVMCGACMDGNGADVDDGRCPACGEPVPDDALSCPHCFTFLYRKPAVAAERREAGRDGRERPDGGA